MNAREKDAHLDLCRRLATALNERDAARAEVVAVRGVLARHWDWKAGWSLHAAVSAALEDGTP